MLEKYGAVWACGEATRRVLEELNAKGQHRLCLEVGQWLVHLQHKQHKVTHAGPAAPRKTPPEGKHSNLLPVTVV